MPDEQLARIEHIVVLMLENRSFDHMLGFLYTDEGNVSPAGDPYEGLTGTESNPDASGNPVAVFRIDPGSPTAYLMPGTNPGEGYSATNLQLFGTDPPTPAAVPTNQGFVTNFAQTIDLNAARKRLVEPGTVPGSVMGCYTPQLLPVLSGLSARAQMGPRGPAGRWSAKAATLRMPMIGPGWPADARSRMRRPDGPQDSLGWPERPRASPRGR